MCSLDGILGTLSGVLEDCTSKAVAFMIEQSRSIG